MKTTMRSILWVILFVILSGFSTQCASRVVYVKTPPPPVRVEVRPVSPYKTAVWIPGHWQWKRGRYVWVPGHWKQARAGYVWVPGHWSKRARGWVWVSGHWKRIR